MASPRRIVVDDTDPSINYSAGQWFLRDSSFGGLTIGNRGPLWNNTAHSTSTNATLSFSFQGTSINAMGSLHVAFDSEGNADPTWTCLLDGADIPFGDGPAFVDPENNWSLCNQPTLDAGSHTLVIQVQSKGQPFYLDRILYTPTPDVSFNDAVLEYTSNDPALTYGLGWQFFDAETNSNQNLTQIHGSQVSIDFHGTALLLTGCVPKEFSFTATTANFAVDGGPASTFTLSGLAPTASISEFNVPIFSIDSLAPGDHQVVVTYEGDSTKTPLVVQTFYVTNTTTPSGASESPSSVVYGSSGPAVSSPAKSAVSSVQASSAGLAATTPTDSSLTGSSLTGSSLTGSFTSSTTSQALPSLTSTAAATTSKHLSNNTAIIVGATIGSVGGLALVFVILLLLLRCRHRLPQIEKFPTDAVEAGEVSVQFGAKHRRDRRLRPKSPPSTAQSASTPQTSGLAASGQGPRDMIPPRLVFVEHQDSGLRLNSPLSLPKPGIERQQEVVDLPPNYSRE